MKKSKVTLTEEELSRVLSQAAVGLLDHRTFGAPNGDTPWPGDPPIVPGCGCVAGAAYAIGQLEFPVEDDRLWYISDAACPGENGRPDYGGTPTRVLRFLERRGLAPLRRA